jgi:hypothetical protein
MRLKHAIILALAGLLAALCLTACSSTKAKAPVTDSLAAIEVKGRSLMEVARALSETFQEAGFNPVPVAPGRDTRLVFERPGSTKDTVVYGDWSLTRLWYRAKLRITRTDPDTQLVTLDAFRVFSHGEAHFEEEKKLGKMSRGTYQEILEKAKVKLN